ncbi:MAG: winged helix-turn-helix domain-containing protein [Parvibaculaceae bacterium]
MSKIAFRIVFDGDHKLGPGKVALLEHIEREGSIRAAAIAMGMSYRRAWLLIANMEEMFGAPVLNRVTGGRQGGGAKPNALGRAIATRYRAMEKATDKALAKDLKALEKLVTTR